MPGEDGSNGTELLFETPETGQLTISDSGHASRVKPENASYTGASLSGPIPRYGHEGQRGIGGSVVAEAMAGKASEHGTHTMDHRDMSPEGLMKWAEEEEKKYVPQDNDHSTAVDPALIRTGYFGGEKPPEWLQEYMDGNDAMPQPSVQFGGTNVVDRVMGNKYLQEHEKLKMLRDMQRAQGTK